MGIVNEGLIYSKLDHPNVAKFHGVVKDSLPGSALRVWDYYNKGTVFILQNNARAKTS